MEGPRRSQERQHLEPPCLGWVRADWAPGRLEKHLKLIWREARSLGFAGKELRRRASAEALRWSGWCGKAGGRGRSRGSRSHRNRRNRHFLFPSVGRSIRGGTKEYPEQFDLLRTEHQ